LKDSCRKTDQSENADESHAHQRYDLSCHRPVRSATVSNTRSTDAWMRRTVPLRPGGDGRMPAVCVDADRGARRPLLSWRPEGLRLCRCEQTLGCRHAPALRAGAVTNDNRSVLERMSFIVSEEYE
jgi:hypothetical protein